MDALIMARNDALDTNGPQMGDRILTDGGSSWLFAVTALYLVSFLAVAVLSLRPFNNEKIFHYLFALALLVGTISYYSQASGLAYRVIYQANQRDLGLARQIHWAKYVNWVVSFPVVVIAMGLISGVSWATIFFNVALTWTWILTFLAGAFTQTNYKWGFFIFGLIAFLYLVVNAFVLDGRRGASRVGITGHHTILSGAIAFLWFLYVLAWALTDGGNRISVTGAWIWFGILDLLLIPGLAFAFIFLSRRWDHGAMNLHFTQYGRVAQGGNFPEKAGAGLGAGAAGAGIGAGAAGAGAGIGHSHHTNNTSTAGYNAGPTTDAYNTAPTTGGYGTGHSAGMADGSGMNGGYGAGLSSGNANPYGNDGYEMDTRGGNNVPMGTANGDMGNGAMGNAPTGNTPHGQQYV